MWCVTKEVGLPRVRSYLVRAYAPCPFDLLASLYWGFCGQSNHLLIAPSISNAHAIAILVHDYCAIYELPPDSPSCMAYIIQYWSWQYRHSRDRYSRNGYIGADGCAPLPRRC